MEDANIIEMRLWRDGLGLIRELVANVLIHQDLAMGGASVMVEIYSNRVEISNPGEPVVPVERFIDGYQSRLKSLTGGAGSFSMNFSHYEPVPARTQKQLMDEYRPPAEEA